MKNLLSILLLFISTVAFSQNYQGYVPFPDSNAVWVDDYKFQYGFTNTNICSTRELVLGNDTVINTKHYITVYATEEYWSNNTTTFPCTWGTYNLSNYIYGFLRNDTINKKVWFRSYYDSTEKILYDFDLNLGDTLDKNLTNSNDATYLIVDSIDTVFIANEYRRRFWFIKDTSYSHLSPLELIEGIGSNRGFHNMQPSYYSQSNLICMATNGSTIYPDTSITCKLITSIKKNNVPKENILLYPNPSSGIINLTFEKELQSIEVYNLQGQKIQKINPRKRSWELPKQSGLYLIRIQDREGSIYTKKIIKN